VCDEDDLCEGSNDEADEDGDGVPDGCDPCSLDGPGADPIALPASGSGITITAAGLDGGGNVVVVDPGATVEVALDYEIVDCTCPGCIDQIEIGLVPGSGVSYCAYSAVPGCGGDTGSDTGTLTAPGGVLDPVRPGSGLRLPRGLVARNVARGPDPRRHLRTLSGPAPGRAAQPRDRPVRRRAVRQWRPVRSRSLQGVGRSS